MTPAPPPMRGKHLGKKKPEPKATLYVELPVSLKDRFDAIAAAHGRKLAAEAAIMVERYCKEEEAKLSREEDE